MPEQAESILALFATACCAGLLAYLLPEGKRSRMAGALKGFCGLCLLLVLARPVQSVLSYLNTAAADPDGLAGRLSEQLDPSVSDFDAEKILSDTVGTVTQADVEAWVTEQLQSTFGIPSSLCRVTVSVNIQPPGNDGSSLSASVEQVWIQLLGEAVTVNPHSVEAYFSRQLNCSCTVSTGG